jgi:hypothetical protein
MPWCRWRRDVAMRKGFVGVSWGRRVRGEEWLGEEEEASEFKAAWYNGTVTADSNYILTYIECTDRCVRTGT